MFGVYKRGSGLGESAWQSRGDDFQKLRRVSGKKVEETFHLEGVF